MTEEVDHLKRELETVKRRLAVKEQQCEDLAADNYDLQDQVDELTYEIMEIHGRLAECIAGE